MNDWRDDLAGHLAHEAAVGIPESRTPPMDKITVTQADREARIDAIARDLVSAGNDETTIAALKIKAKELAVGTPVQHIALPNVHGVIGDSVTERLCVAVTKPHMLDSAIYFADPRDLRLAQTDAQMAAPEELPLHSWAIKQLWVKHGGGQHGPHVETYTIEESAFYRFANELQQTILATLSASTPPSSATAAATPSPDTGGDSPAPSASNAMRDALERIASGDGIGGPDAELQCADIARAALAGQGTTLEGHPCYHEPSGSLMHRAFVTNAPMHCERCGTELDRDKKQEAGAPLSWATLDRQTVEHCAQIADEHAEDAWEIARREGQNGACASGRNYGARSIAAAIRASMDPNHVR